MKGYKHGTRRVTSTCAYCGVLFEHYTSKRRRCCSKSCSGKSGVHRLGKKHSSETLLKLRMASLNNPNVMSNTFKPGHNLWDNHMTRKNWIKPGTKPPNWQGGKRTKSQIIKDDPRYKFWRLQVFKRDKFTCQMCGAKGVYIEADHIYSKTKYPDKAFDIDNGRTLCKPCHIKTPNYGGKAVKYENIHS